MSRIGKKQIELPKEVKLTVQGAEVTVEGPKGKLVHMIPDGIALGISERIVEVKRASDERRLRQLHGLSRTLVANMVEGVSKGFKKELEIVGVGYRAEKEDATLKLQLGYSHPVLFKEPEGISISVEKQNITVEGIDKCLVGQVAAKIRAFRKPDVYKGKGVRYAGEIVRKKVGKVGSK